LSEGLKDHDDSEQEQIRDTVLTEPPTCRSRNRDSIGEGLSFDFGLPSNFRFHVPNLLLKTEYVSSRQQHADGMGVKSIFNGGAIF
jgi:hypothetical protein